MEGKHILIIEDEASLARFLELELKHESYAVSKAADGRAGLDLALAASFDLILLDILLPGLNGLEVLRRLRREKNTPVILLTARDSTMDKVSGLDMGANDYVTKPFQIEELLARIRNLLRQANLGRAVEEELHCGPLSLHVARHEARVAGKLIELTAREFELLLVLLRHQNYVLSRESLLDKVWGYDFAGDSNIVDVYIRYLRQKIDDPFDIKLLHTVRGVGYCLRHEA